MQSVVRKWGNSPAVRIPAPLMVAANLAVDQPIDIREEDGRLVISAARRRRRYTLDELLAGITPENIHPEIDMGSPVGREIIDD